MKVKEESEKTGLKFNIQKSKIMASGPFTSWQIDGKTMETVRDFIFLGSENTAGCDCTHEIKRHLLLGRKAMTNLDSILKSRNITAKGSPVVMQLSLDGNLGLGSSQAASLSPWPQSSPKTIGEGVGGCRL